MLGLKYARPKLDDQSRAEAADDPMKFDNDLNRAQMHLDNMAATSDVTEYAHEWQEFLFHLERVWERALRAYEYRPWFSHLNHPYTKLRKGDPLLRYLKQARNAETHTLQGTLNSSLNVAVREKYGRAFQLSRVSTSLENGCLTIDLESPEILLDLDADVFRSAPSLARIRCRGKWYNPPKTHLGNPLPAQNPVIVGKIGLEFCRAFIGEVTYHAEERNG